MDGLINHVQYRQMGQSTEYNMFKTDGLVNGAQLARGLRTNENINQFNQFIIGKIVLGYTIL